MVNKNVQENRVRNILNYLLNTELIKSKPIWNKNSKTGRLLELDGYDKKLKIAFEYQGKHHFENFVFGSKDILKDIQQRDEDKKNNCISNGIVLIVVNTIKNTNNFNSFMEELSRAIKESGIQYKIDSNTTKIEELFNSIEGTKIQEIQLLNANNYAKSKGGICHSKYISAKTKMEWSCSNPNHPHFSSSFDNTINNGRWCPECKIEQITIKKTNKDGDRLTKEYAKSKGGICHSNYIKSSTKMEWSCSDKSHSHWFASYNYVVNKGYWCPECNKITKAVNKLLPK